ncbi:MAG: hypothetical protein ACRC5C_15520 [Bacilli bacterium]
MTVSKEEIRFKSFLKLVGLKEIERIISLIYEQLNRSFGIRIGLGEEAYTFAAAVLYTYYASEAKPFISELLTRIWLGETHPSQLKTIIESNFRRNGTTLYPFYEGIQWLKQHAVWIEQHDMRTETTPVQQLESVSSASVVTFMFAYSYDREFLEQKKHVWLHGLKDRFFYAHDRPKIAELAPHWLPTSMHCPACEESLFDILFPEEDPFRTYVSQIGLISIYQLFTCPNCMTLFAPFSHPLLNSDWLFHPITNRKQYEEAMKTLSYLCSTANQAQR